MSCSKRTGSSATGSAVWGSSICYHFSSSVMAPSWLTAQADCLYGDRQLLFDCCQTCCQDHGQLLTRDDRRGTSEGHPARPRSKIAAHAYHRIDYEEVWVTLRDDVPRMDEAIKRWRHTQG